MKLLNAARAALIALFALLTIGVGISPAQQGQLADPSGDLDAEKVALAHEYLEAGKAGDMLAKIAPAIMQQMTTAMGPHIQKELGNEAEAARYRAFMEAISKELEDSLVKHKQDFLNAMAAAHARVNTREELKAAAAFFSSPAGQKFADATPKLVEEAMPKIMAIQQGEDIEIPEPASPEKKQAAEKMLEASQSDKLSEQLLAQALSAADALPPGDKNAIDRGMEKYTREVAKNITENKDKLNRLFVAVWSRQFSVEEMNAVTAFYESDAGRSFMASLPKTVEEQQKQLLPLMGKIMGELMPTVMRLIQEQQN